MRDYAVVAVSDEGEALGRVLCTELDAEFFRPVKGELPELTKQLFSSRQGLVYIMAVGITVRMIAPYVNSKFSDPAVIAVDDAGRFAVSLLSGHEGGANALSYRVAGIVDAEPVLSTGSDTAKTLVLGIGCRKGAEKDRILEAVGDFLGNAGIDKGEIRHAATIELKRREAGLTAACEELGFPVLFLPEERIRTLGAGGTPSPAAKRQLDLPGVAEPCAVLSSRNGELLVPKTIVQGITLALSRDRFFSTGKGTV